MTKRDRDRLLAKLRKSLLVPIGGSGAAEWAAWEIVDEHTCSGCDSVHIKAKSPQTYEGEIIDNGQGPHNYMHRGASTLLHTHGCATCTDLANAI